MRKWGLWCEFPAEPSPWEDGEGRKRGRRESRGALRGWPFRGEARGRPGAPLRKGEQGAGSQSSLFAVTVDVSTTWMDALFKRLEVSIYPSCIQHGPAELLLAHLSAPHELTLRAGATDTTGARYPNPPSWRELQRHEKPPGSSRWERREPGTLQAALKSEPCCFLGGNTVAAVAVRVTLSQCMVTVVITTAE